MSIEITLLISVVSVAAAIYFGLKSQNRDSKKDTAEEVSQMTRVEVKLDTISSGISEIKSDIKNVRAETKELRDRLTRCEVKVDALEGEVKHLKEEITAIISHPS